MKKKDFVQARQSMIDSQIHPMGVVSEAVLDAFMAVPREEFVPEDKAGICYCDEDIEIAPKRYLMEPSVLARLIQAVNPMPNDVALTIGSGIGYNAAILSHLVSTVVALEEDQKLIDRAQASWDKLTYCNIAGIKGALVKGAPDNAPYDIIMINGAVCEIPKELKEQLGIGGRLVALVKKAGQNIAKATLVQRVADGVYSERILFDAGTPYLCGFEPKKEFVF
ncbi:MAG TPA: protein-L-isoaspartate O-methyltransferase [Alphaproteobacteria bacterium]|nr:protein-L-isoaspartate O-methyltransferase [Alphaproteobacteria bacterium]